MAAFSNMPDDFRLACLARVHDAGGESAGYYDGGFCVHLPADPAAMQSLGAQLASLGLRRDGADEWFPVGGDNPQDAIRHHGLGTAACPRGDRPGYYRTRRFVVA